MSDKQSPIVILPKSNTPSVSFTLCNMLKEDKKTDITNAHLVET